MGMGMGRQARHRARASRAAQVASIRAGRTQPLALAIGHRKGKASTCKASGRTGQAGTGRHRTRARASGYASRHRAPQGQGQHLQDTGRGQAGPVSPQHPAPQPLALSSGTGPGTGRRATPGQRQAAKLQGIGHQRQQVGTASTGHRVCKVRRAASIRARAGTAPRQGQAVTQQGTGHRAPGTGHRAPAPGQGLGFAWAGGRRRAGPHRPHRSGRVSTKQRASDRTQSGGTNGAILRFLLTLSLFCAGYAGYAGNPHKQGLAAYPATSSLAGTAGTKWHLSTVQNKLSTDFDQILSKIGRLSCAGHRFIVDLN
jgi:hypothetical protein